MDMLSMFYNAPAVYENVYIAILRWVVPILTIVLLFRAVRPLLTFRREPEIWGWLHTADGRKEPLTHWENLIGRSTSSEVVINIPTVSRTHAVLTRYDDGSWSVADADSKGGVYVNGKRIKDLCPVSAEDVITIGGLDMVLQPISQKQERRQAQLRTKASSVVTSLTNTVLLSLLQLVFCIAYLFSCEPEAGRSVVMGFGGLMLCQWLLLLFYICIKRTSFEIETIAFFLCTMGMCVISAVAPAEAFKQLIATVLGMVLFLSVGWSLRVLDRVEKVRYLAGIAGIGFLVITLLFGTEYYGAKNWLMIGSLSLQPSELSKVCFVYMGAASMAQIVTRKNIFAFIVYSVAICGCLALMNDFGTALIFFCAFLVIAYMRSGNIGTVALAITALAFAAVVALKIAPHALRRFASWRHIWEDPLDAGFQQTRALMAMASGGILGVGAGRGFMKRIFAADSDVAVATLTEEWGIVMLVLVILCVIALAVFSIRSASVGRSSFYVIGACTASGILLIQVILNALGTVDVVPLTGVTFPFLSNGGSSMIGAWGLLAFVKAADTRQNASFAVRLIRNGGAEDE